MKTSEAIANHDARICTRIASEWNPGLLPSPRATNGKGVRYRDEDEISDFIKSNDMIGDDTRFKSAKDGQVLARQGGSVREKT